MTFGDLEYVTLRLVRKFIFTQQFLVKHGHRVPFWRANANQADPFWIIERYQRPLKAKGILVAGKNLVEVGVGATNSTAYAFASLGAGSVVCVEPFEPLDPAADQIQLKMVADKSGIPAETLARRVTRVRTMDEVEETTADLVLSHSVLEHVDPLDPFFLSLKKCLKPNGEAVHFVDYRDHFFKYPYHFLKFRATTWNRWLNPGDLPRWRIYDHLESLARTGWEAEVPVSEIEVHEKAAVEGKVSPDFRLGDERLWITQAGLWSRPR